MYTVFAGDTRSDTRRNRIGLTIFCRTLAACIREGAQEGDSIIGWSNSGGQRALYKVQRTAKGTLRAVKV